MQDIKLLDIPFDAITQSETLAIIETRIKNGEHTRIATINPEFVLEAQKNTEFKQALKSADLHLADGIGILWATHFLNLRPAFPRLYKLIPRIYSLWQCIYTLGLLPFTKRVSRNPLPERVTGSDLFIPLIAKLSELNERIFLLGGAPGVGEKTAQILQQKIPNLQVAGYYPGSPHKDEAQKIIAIINDSKATALFVAFQFPAQDIWIAQYMPRMHQLKVAIGVGGAFDFIAGASHLNHTGTKTKRAPKWVIQLNLEWLWRLITQPYRWQRIWKATISFASACLKEKINTSNSSSSSSS